MWIPLQPLQLHGLDSCSWAFSCLRNRISSSVHRVLYGPGGSKNLKYSVDHKCYVKIRNDQGPGFVKASV